jgi:hypothetical protein
MGRLLRVPFLLDLIRTADPSEIRAFANDDRLDRAFSGRGPLLNRVLTRKVRNVLAVKGVPLPSVAVRGDGERARMQAQLQAELDAAAARIVDDDSVIDLARAVRGLEDTPLLEHAVQQTVGRLFVNDYRATEQSWAAAQLLDKAVHSMNPLASIFWRITGRIAHAQDLLAEMVHHDRAGVHATGIAVHNLVRGFQVMRNLFAHPNAPDPAAGHSVVARCLQAPESALREASTEASARADDIGPGTLVMLDLRAAQQHDAEPEIVFMSGSWSQCPAAAWVPALIRAVWEQALHLPPPYPDRVGGSFRVESTRVEATRRCAIYRSILGCNLALQFALGVLMLAAPLWFCRFLGLVPSFAADLVRIWGVMLLLLLALYAVGWFDPIYTRWTNVVGIVGRYATAILYLFLRGRFLWLALFDGMFAAALTWAYSQAIRAELMSRP